MHDDATDEMMPQSRKLVHNGFAQLTGNEADVVRSHTGTHPQMTTGVFQEQPRHLPPFPDFTTRLPA